MQGGRDPPGVSKLSVVELSGKTADCSRQVLTIGGAFFDHRSKIDPVLGVIGQNFSKSEIFQLHIIIFQKLLIVATSGFHQRVPRSILNSVTCRVSVYSVQFLDGIYVTHSVPKGYSVTLIGKIA